MDPQVTGPEASQAELRMGFDAFIEAARRLEQSYAALKVRADAVDLQLAEANRALDRTLTEREAIFAALPMGLMAFAGDGELTWCNTEAKRLRELTELAGVNVAEAPEGDTSTNGLTVRVQRIDLEDRGKLVLVEDRSRLAHLEGEVDRLDRLAGLSELALGIAHEIKNPLNGVMGFASLMERSSDPNDSRRYAAKIHQGLSQVDSIVKALLAFARPEGKAGPVASVETIVVEAAICAGVPSSRVMATGDLQERAESGALVRVLDNLFRNSLEAGGEDVTLRVEVVAREREVEIEVTDDGPGISAELAQKVFEPFVSSKARGHGLGLALASRVVGFLGGGLELVNPGEAGAKFRVRIPRAPGGS
jgi:signal transduction histidine kinase